MEEFIIWIKTVDSTPEAIIVAGFLITIGLILHGISG